MEPKTQKDRPWEACENVAPQTVEGHPTESEKETKIQATFCLPNCMLHLGLPPPGRRKFLFQVYTKVANGLAVALLTPPQYYNRHQKSNSVMGSNCMHHGLLAVKKRAC